MKFLIPLLLISGCATASNQQAIDKPAKKIVITINKPAFKVIARYDRSERVRWVQTMLKQKGFFKAGITDYYGDKTDAAVIEFQIAHGINEIDVGEQTWELLNK